jgi:poly(3-hydroxybutyrate) depolymerase
MVLRVLWMMCLIASIRAQPAGSKPYDAEKHQAIRSSGCGKDSPYPLGERVERTKMSVGVLWTFRIHVPKGYDKDTPMPLIFQHPGWGVDAKYEEKHAGITGLADSRGFISVTPQGMNDNKDKAGGPWYSWNVVGSTQSPGQAGPTCTDKTMINGKVANASHPTYCYESCAPCLDRPQCWWTTCDESITPTGTGRDIGGFIPSLYDTLEDELCIDTTREFAAGESNGGMMTYQVGVALGARLAAIVPQFGSFHRGFNMVPLVGLPLLATHGKSDSTVPGNATYKTGWALSDDGYYYTPTSEIFYGNSYSSGWVKANGCSGTPSHYPTKYDGVKGLWCESQGSCTGGDVVRCAYEGGHDYFNVCDCLGWNDEGECNKFDETGHCGPKYNGELVVDFLLRWTKPSHIGRGYSVGEVMGAGHLLEDVVYGRDEQPTPPATLQWQQQTLQADSAGHYGNPDRGCLSDEDVILAGSGRVCAPRIGSSNKTSPPIPKCIIGGVSPLANGCPINANIVANSKAWPVCLAKSNTTGGYDRGEFHCFLVCPCRVGAKGSQQCGDESHRHCPQGARCMSGSLRKRDQGVCAYPMDSVDTLLV